MTLTAPPIKRWRDFAQVDVFTQEPLFGNPVAVILDSDGISTEEMHAFTSWTNLSEATFLTAPTHPEADYAVRIFCPGRELPFAGHPTLGTCHAWLEAGGEPRGDEIIQECSAGLIKIRRDGQRLAFAAPPRLQSGPLSERALEEVLGMLELDPAGVVAHQWCDNGPEWRALLLDSTERLYQARPRGAHFNIDLGLIAPSTRPEIDFEVRGLFPGNSGVTEDPATGSLNAALAQWLIEEGIAPTKYTALQGLALGRRGVIEVERTQGEIWIGGHSVTVFRGGAHLSSDI